METETFVLHIVKKILTEIRSLVTPFYKIQSQIDSIAEQIKTQGEREKATPILRAELQVPRSIEEKREARDHRKDRHDKLMLGVQILTLIAVAFYAFLTYEVWREMVLTSDAGMDTAKEARRSAAIAQQALTQAREQFRQDQRPYVWLTNNLGGPTLFVPPRSSTSEGYVAWPWHYTNYGKTPAYNVHFNGTMYIGDQASTRKHIYERSKMAAPLPPGKDDFSTAVYNRSKVSLQDFQRLMGADGLIVVFGHFDYTDAFRDKKYETGFCFLHLATGAVEWCPNPEENYIK
jgi:hypothetical protein